MLTNHNKKLSHNWFKIMLTIVAIVIYIAFLAMNGLVLFGYNIFPRSFANVTGMYYLDMSPQDWLYYTIWPIVYVWQLAWLVYSFVYLFRFTRHGELLYRIVDLFRGGIFFFFIINNLLVVGWYFLWTYLYIGWSLLLIAVSCLPLYVCLGISFRTVYYNKVLLKNLGLQCDVFSIRFLLENGLAFYLTWLSILTCYNFAVYTSYGLGLKQQDASTIALFFIFALALLYFVYENFIWQRFMLYIYSPWLVLLLTYDSILLEHWRGNDLDRNTLITLVMFCLFTLFAAFKLFMICLFKTFCSHRYDKYREILRKV